LNSRAGHKKLEEHKEKIIKPDLIEKELMEEHIK
jgi:hypothetical protein